VREAKVRSSGDDDVDDDDDDEYLATGGQNM
jgi:hypothetical protein